MVRINEYGEIISDEELVVLQRPYLTVEDLRKLVQGKPRPHRQGPF